MVGDLPLPIPLLEAKVRNLQEIIDLYRKEAAALRLACQPIRSSKAFKQKACHIGDANRFADLRERLEKGEKPWSGLTKSSRG